MSEPRVCETANDHAVYASELLHPVSFTNGDVAHPYAENVKRAQAHALTALALAATSEGSGLRVANREIYG